MNLSTEPWIPVVWDNGNPGLVSLSEVFQRGEQISDLAVRPHERIAVMRLLICIAQAALDGPADEDDWNACGSRIAPSSLGYLKKWERVFELFGDGPRFLQVTNLKKPSKKEADDDEGSSVSKLDLALATGHTSTLFDNSGGAERQFTSAQLALNLLAFQCFSPLIGRGYLGRSPCVEGNMLHALLKGASLAQSVRLNLIPKHTIGLCFGADRWGVPLWELPPALQPETPATHNATTTYLGRLVPLARAICISTDRRTMLLDNGLPYPEFRETTAAIVVRERNGQPERVFLAVSLDRAIWRELHSVTLKAVTETGNTIGGPLALRNLDGEEGFDIWTGGLATDFKAKVLDAVESVFHVPAAMLHEPNQQAYEKGVEFAETAEYRLRRAISMYHKALGDDLDRPETRDRRRRVQSKATIRFWTDAESRVGELLSVAERPEILGLDNNWPGTGWGKAIQAAVLTAYEAACPHDTARQMRAYTLGRRALFAAPARAGVEKEVES